MRLAGKTFTFNNNNNNNNNNKLHNEEFLNLSASTNIIRVIKSMRMRWSGQVALMGQMRNEYNILVGKP
jgi:hypothetical protein